MFAKKTKKQMKLQKAGADFVGAEELIPKIEKRKLV